MTLEQIVWFGIAANCILQVIIMAMIIHAIDNKNKDL